MAGDDDVWDFYEDSAGEWRWRRTATNGAIVGAASEGYRRRDDCEANAERHGYRKGGRLKMGRFMALTGDQVRAAMEGLERDLADDPLWQEMKKSHQAWAEEEKKRRDAELAQAREDSESDPEGG